MHLVRNVVCGFVLVSGTAFASDVLVVAQNAGPGVDFTDLQSAVDAASDGDIVLLKAFVGEGATIDQKSLTLVVDSGLLAVLTTPLRIRNVDATRFVVVRGVRVDAPAESKALTISNCAGSVWIESCTLRAPHPSKTGVETVRIEESSNVVFVRTAVTGADGFTRGFSNEGATALFADGATTRLAAYELDVTGGKASKGSPSHGAPGGDAIRFYGLDAFFGASRLEGGDGSDGNIGFGGSGGTGGDALEVSGGNVVRVWQWANDLYGGSGGYGQSGPAPDGAGLFDPNHVVVSTGQLPRSLAAQATTRAGQMLHVSAAIKPGGLVVPPNPVITMWVAIAPQVTALSPTLGVLHAMPTGGFLVLGTLSPVGLSVDLLVPPLPVLVGEGFTCFAQASAVTPSVATLTSPTAFVILDPSL